MAQSASARIHALQQPGTAWNATVAVIAVASAGSVSSGAGFLPFRSSLLMPGCLVHPKDFEKTTSRLAQVVAGGSAKQEARWCRQSTRTSRISLVSLLQALEVH